MKKVFLFAAMLISFAAFSQDLFKPTLKQGSKIRYTAYSDGQEIPLVISLDSVATGMLKIGWNIDGYGSGAWIMGSKSLESANKGWWGNPSPGSEEKLADDQQVLIISKALWNSLQKDKKYDYEGQTYSLKQATDADKLMLNGKQADALLVESGSTKMWILNDPNFPMLLKIQGNTKGVDLTAVEVL